ncbi:capsular polysaccharide export protein, LipB/KpsS family [Vibrio bivalvicida]|uniref:Capsule biosynthesis protein n=1 Tax=Vibrio bivalvicida TaxID=1276888 RepID=A0ABV4MP49_9VIBR
MKFLSHAGPWSDTYLEHIVKEISNDNENLILSAHKSVDSSGLWSMYYKQLDALKNVSFSSSPIDDDIIVRCRLLRSISKNDALLHLNAMKNAIIDVFDRYGPDIVLSETIDSYIMDLLYFECKARGVPFVGLVTVFVNGYFRVSARGEYNFIRDVSDEEVEKVLKLLEDQTYLPGFVQKDKVGTTRKIITKWIRNLIKIPYFSLKRIMSGDFFNYHYWQSVITSKEWAHLFPRFEIGDREWKGKIKLVDSKVIYIPLQMIPEATVDYWCESSDIINYDQVLVDFIDSHKELHFLIKEHPNVIGYRNPKLYNILESKENVTICPTQTPSNLLIDYYDAAMVWTGSVGFEVALRSKPVLSLSPTYYFPDERFYKKISISTDSQEIVDYIDDYSELSNGDKNELVRHLLSGLDRGQLRVDGTWDENKDDDLEQMKVLSASLAKYIKNEIDKR